jgi:hypothetical protein
MYIIHVSIYSPVEIKGLSVTTLQNIYWFAELNFNRTQYIRATEGLTKLFKGRE